MLTPAQIDQFNRDGYLVIEDVIDEATRQAVIDEYAALMDGLYDQWHAEGHVPAPQAGWGFWDKLGAAFRAGHEWYQPLDISLPHADITDDTPMHFGPAVFDMATHPRILDIAEALLGPELTSNPIQHVRIKPPERLVDGDEVRAHIVSTDWHQDRGVTLAEADETQMLTVWLAITDATVENGCLQVMPGIEEEMLPHCSLRQTGIRDRYLPKKEPVPAPVKAGGAVIFHPLTPHASLANMSDGYRWSFDLRYNVTGQSTGRDHFPSFVARSRANPETELKDWRVWRRMWEDTRHSVAHGTHIPQHRWPTSGPYCA
ncbi:phytanoyl-CoA dioxygenase family protein [Pseudaestuariivita atlantica]|uniref:Phytanoyl-CoA dioxygenase n=1 Tax=Pseudaestuariivita atlantica TaxID=1317121 RepID=A0A0L1JW45_9RHOB|nr:phytanoyl-CoA dioxygenase family protein [Pseudaestuariivita atlantica]KNG95628.1 phytanoyl-CoA dioxygenase [Pseudaestuariivita atlantica]